jgi:outer membrane protein assembly factor BamB
VHNFAALDVKKGKLVWKHTPSKQQCFPTSQATIADGVVFIGTNRGLHAVESKTGKALWTAGLSSPSSAPIVVGDLCIVGAKKGLYALSIAKKGRKVWTFPLKKSTTGSVAYQDGVLYFIGDDTLFALSAADGKKVHWKMRVDVGESFGIGPLVTATHVFTGIDYYELACVDRASGKVAWKRKLERSINKHGWAVNDSKLVVKDGDGRLNAFDTKSGKPVWQTKEELEDGEHCGYGACGPTICGSSVIAITASYYRSPRLRAWDVSTGKQRWEIAAKVAGKAHKWNYYSRPFVADGVLYVQADEGIVALK